MKKVSSYGGVVPVIGPYSHICEIGNLIFMSGQIALGKDSELVTPDLEQQTRIVLGNIRTILGKVGLTLESVVKTTIYMTDLSKFSVVNGVYGEFFTANYPVRTTVQVSALPKGAQIEIEVICCR